MAEWIALRDGYSDELEHHGILGQKWGVRHYQYSDGSLTPEGRKRYSKSEAYYMEDAGAQAKEADAKHKVSVTKEVASITSTLAIAGIIAKSGLIATPAGTVAAVGSVVSGAAIAALNKAVDKKSQQKADEAYEVYLAKVNTMKKYNEAYDNYMKEYDPDHRIETGAMSGYGGKKLEKQFRKLEKEANEYALSQLDVVDQGKNYEDYDDEDDEDW